MEIIKWKNMARWVKLCCKVSVVWVTIEDGLNLNFNNVKCVVYVDWFFANMVLIVTPDKFLDLGVMKGVS